MVKKSKTKAEVAHLLKIKNMNCYACELMDEPVYDSTPCDAHHVHGYHGFCGKASDFETLPICKPHHQSGGYGVAYHATGRTKWEETFQIQYCEEHKGTDGREVVCDKCLLGKVNKELGF
tara:strand:+ start:2495 stop:2854 length:360 start_codon:yes stop_codon:yes gene_type:complete